MNRVLLSAIAATFVATPLLAQQPTTPAQPNAPMQPAYPASPQAAPGAVNPRRELPAEVGPQCHELTGLERAECERRDMADVARPPGVTTGMMTREQEAKAAAAEEADSDRAIAEAPTEQLDEDAITEVTEEG